MQPFAALSVLLVLCCNQMIWCKNVSKCECGLEIGTDRPILKRQDLPPVMTRITNAEIAPEHKFPWIVYIETEGGNATHMVTRSCTGSIISARHILTAAHCLFPDQRAEDVKIFIFQGCQKELKSYIERPIKVDKVFKHPDYKTGESASTSDIAIFKLRNDLKITGKLMPVCLSEKGFDRDKNIDNLVAAGWGRTNSGLDLKDSDCLRYADLGLVSGRDCNDQYGEIDTKMTMCAGGKTNICDGDSGGPLMSRKDGHVFQVGVTSFGVEDCGLVSGIASGFERVSVHTDWIRKVTGDDVCFK